MLIHVVKPGDTIQSIAAYYGVSVMRLIQDNGLQNNLNLVIGQSLVILIPKVSYTANAGDTIQSIADLYQVTIEQILRNNIFLYDRPIIYPGEIIVIEYNTTGKITTQGYTIPYIDKKVLRKTLPYLTYLCILNYTAKQNGEVIGYYDETEIIQLAKEFNVVPMMLLTTLTVQGEANISAAYDLLINEEYQNKQIENILMILKTKGYAGINISFEYINISNLRLYENYFTKISKRLKEEGYLVALTLNPNIVEVGSELKFEKVDYSILDKLAQSITFMNYEWAVNINPPSPISSIFKMNAFLEYLLRFAPPEKLNIGLATIGYDWELPYSAGLSSVNSLTIENAVKLAGNYGEAIQFDEISQTPYFYYTTDNDIEHIVWFIDARSIKAIVDLVTKYQLLGVGIWNLSVYNSQLWSIINSLYEIERV